MPKTVLMIDDFKPIHQLVKAHLADESLVVHSAYDGETGLATALALQPDLILLDVDMPGMNGFDVCRLLKANPLTEEIRVMFLTAAGSIDEKICGLDLQAVDYITKPFDPAELCARVRAAFRTQLLLDLLPKSEAQAAADVIDGGARAAAKCPLVAGAADAGPGFQSLESKAAGPDRRRL